MEVTGKKVLVFGSGISGIGAVKLLEDHGAEVILYDGNERTAWGWSKSRDYPW